MVEGLYLDCGPGLHVTQLTHIALEPHYYIITHYYIFSYHR